MILPCMNVRQIVRVPPRGAISDLMFLEFLAMKILAPPRVERRTIILRCKLSRVAYTGGLGGISKNDEKCLGGCVGKESENKNKKKMACDSTALGTKK